MRASGSRHLQGAVPSMAPAYITKLLPTDTGTTQISFSLVYFGTLASAHWTCVDTSSEAHDCTQHNAGDVSTFIAVVQHGVYEVQCDVLERFGRRTHVTARAWVVRAGADFSVSVRSVGSSDACFVGDVCTVSWTASALPDLPCTADILVSWPGVNARAIACDVPPCA